MRRTAPCRRLLAAIAALLAAPLLPSAYVIDEGRWPLGSTLTMHLQLGAATGPLSDGATGWNQVVANAMAAWNTHLDLIEFAAVQGSSAPIENRNMVNNVVFDTTVFGRRFDDGVLALTTTWIVDGVRDEANITFNSAVQWNSYRGPQRGSGSATVYDLHRFALHELGHVVGLTHPDQAGQSVAALMNSRVGDPDALQEDDIEGGRAIYGAGVPSIVAFPPRNETADFINRLGALYRDELGSPGFITYVDAEGAGVWVPEYTRYRVGQCAHIEATNRVFLQISDGLLFGVCGLTPEGAIPFPPRNEGVVFMGSLNGLYRDTLGRGTVTSFVDEEGIVVWVMEYLRYRLNGCGHEAAVEKVFMQIRGQGIQPTC